MTNWEKINLKYFRSCVSIIYIVCVYTSDLSPCMSVRVSTLFSVVLVDSV
jgi:hypothetical protein